MFHSTAFLYLVVAGMMAEAGVIPGLIARINLRAEGSLESRQTGTNPAVPPQCETQCDPINSVIAAGCQISTCCQASFEMGYFNCFECVGQAVNLTDYSAIQQTLDGNSGFSLPKLTFPGQNPNRPLSSVSSAPASTLASSVTRPGLPLSTSFLSTLSQTTVTSVSLTPIAPQSTVTSVPTDTAPAPSPSTAASFGVRTIAMQNINFGLISVTLVIGMLFYQGL
ncbi:hypothetical protein BDZ97DRAFT_1698567 [Flammula alnicola]|nr:hypothetical protein BDZ97DRAFT_1698567 [Flammula alnicola]